MVRRSFLDKYGEEVIFRTSSEEVIFRTRVVRR